MRIEIDGNDGVGKTTYVKALRKIFPDIEILDRGALTKATDTNVFIPEKDVVYIILDVDIYTCQDRIKERGDDITEKYHTLKDLEYYRNKFIELSIKHNIPIYYTCFDFKTNIKLISNYIKGFLKAKEL